MQLKLLQFFDKEIVICSHFSFFGLYDHILFQKLTMILQLTLQSFFDMKVHLFIQSVSQYSFSRSFSEAALIGKFISPIFESFFLIFIFHLFACKKAQFDFSLLLRLFCNPFQGFCILVKVGLIFVCYCKDLTWDAQPMHLQINIFLASAYSPFIAWDRSCKQNYISQELRC